jgi:phytoene dehydrogenase-like protein
VDDTLGQLSRSPRVRTLLHALVRVASYVNAPAHGSGGAALRQLKLALAGGVLYLDSGWGRLVSSLEDAARAARVRIRTAARAKAVERDERVRGVRLGDGSLVEAAAVVLAMGPSEAAALVPGDRAVSRLAARCVPARAASLDVALTRLPQPRPTFVLGVDEPLYLSVHSAVAQLAPPEGALIHVMRYLTPDEDPDREDLRGELEGLLDQAQPGWRRVVVAQHLQRHLTVSNGIPLAALGGLAGRPGSTIPDAPGLYVAGDWVGPVGQIADASFASGREAGRQAALFAAPAGARPASPVAA